jgi:hypothetical protein
VAVCKERAIGRKVVRERDNEKKQKNNRKTMSEKER